MWTCRKCNAEVEANFEICWSCGTSIDGAQDPAFRRFDRDEDVPASVVSVMPQAAIATEKLIAIATYWIAGQAHEVLCILEADGIPVTVAYEFGIATDWFLDNATGCIQLQVAESQVEKARKVLADHPKEATPLPPAPPKPPEPDEETKFADQPWLAAIPKDLSREETLKFLESQISALIDSKDVADWKVNPAFHPDVMAFIQKNANNVGFVQKAQALQRNRAKYFATMRAQALAPKPPEKEEEVKPAGPSFSQRFAQSLKYVLVTLPLRVLRRLLKWTLILGLASVILVVLGSLAYRGWAKGQLESAIREVEEKDPAWQWEYLQSTRKEIADKDNAATIVEATSKQIVGTAVPYVLQTEIYPSNQALNDNDVARIREWLAKNPAALTTALKLANLSEGRWPAGQVIDPPNPETPEEKACLIVTVLLYREAQLAAHEQRNKDALIAVRAMLGVARSIGDDPNPTNQRARIILDRMACSALQRVLAQVTQVSAADLDNIAPLLQQEAKELPLTQALRGRRARVYEQWGLVAAGDPRATQELQADLDREGFQLYTKDTFALPVERWLRGGKFSRTQAQSLLDMTEHVELSKKSIDEQVAQNKAGTLPPAVGKLMEDYHGTCAELLCAEAALRLEKVRLTQGKWPTTWETPAPLDPFTGQPLQIKRRDDGVTVCSVGPDGKEIGFRLWDVADRAKPAAANSKSP
jgi:hypothetical protein